LLNYFM